MTNDKEVLIKALEILLEDYCSIEDTKAILHQVAPNDYVLHEILDIAEGCIRIKRDLSARIEEYRNRQS